MNILIIHPSGQEYGSGFYLQMISEKLLHLSNNVFILCEGQVQSENKNGVHWKKIRLDGPMLKKDIVESVKSFDPELIIEVGVRTNPILATFHLTQALKIPFVIQCEDDEYEPFRKYSGYKSTDILDLTNGPITLSNILVIIYNLSWRLFLKSIFFPRTYRWVEPLTRYWSYQRAISYLSIWYPMSNRLKSWWGDQKNHFILPPVDDINRLIKISKQEFNQNEFLLNQNINPNSFLIFVSGTIYSYSKEIIIFTDALEIFIKKMNIDVTLLITGRVSKDNKLEFLEDRLFQKVNVGFPNEDIYLKLIKSSHLIACPGTQDVFNEFRLPSRLIKAMAFSKNIFTFSIGFGEYIEKHDFSFLTYNDDPGHWAEVIEEAYLKKNIISSEGASFALNNFDAADVAKNLSVFLKDELDAFNASQGIIKKDKLVFMLLYAMSFARKIMRKIKKLVT